MTMRNGSDPRDKSLSAKCIRFAIVAGPAGVVTFGLFLLMQGLVVKEEFVPTELQAYDVTPYIEATVQDDEIDVADKVDLLEAIDRLPRPVIESKLTTNADDAVSFHHVTGSTYTKDLQFDRVTNVPHMQIVDDRSPHPITPPVPRYPVQAEKRGLEGSCDVVFSVSVRGDPFDLRANCSDRVFRRSAIDAVQRVRFVPKIVNGQPVAVTGVVYPLQYRLGQ